MHERHYGSSSFFTVYNYPHNTNILKIGHYRDSISPNEERSNFCEIHYFLSLQDLQDYLDIDIKIIRKKRM